MGGDRFITRGSGYDHRSGPDYSSDNDVLLEDGTSKKGCGCILEHIYEDVDRPFMSYTIDRWYKKSLCEKHAEEKEREIKLKKEKQEREEQLRLEEKKIREEQNEKDKKMKERFMDFEERIKLQNAEVCEGLPIDLVSDKWKYRKLMKTNPEVAKVIKLSQEKPRARYKVCKNRVEWLLEQPIDIFNLNVKRFTNGVIDAFIEEDCPGEPNKAGIKNQIITLMWEETQGYRKKKKITGHVGEKACLSRKPSVLLNHLQKLRERKNISKTPEKESENKEREERIKRAEKLQNKFKEKREREERIKGEERTKREERIKKAEKLKKRFKQQDNI